MEYQKASNEYDMLKGCVNRIFVTNDKEELPALYAGALNHLSLIFLYGKERFSERLENPVNKVYNPEACGSCEYLSDDNTCCLEGPCPHS